MKRAIFFDKDGTLIPNVPYNVDPKLIKLSAGAAELVQNLKAAGFLLFVVSNQAGVARGFFDETALEAVWIKLNELCRIEFDGFYFCPHHKDGVIERYKIACDCRKPAAGMLLQAAREHNVELAKSWMLGDTLNDIEAGRLAGCRTILINSGVETEWITNENREPHFTIKSLSEATQIILREDGEHAGR